MPLWLTIALQASHAKQHVTIAISRYHKHRKVILTYLSVFWVTRELVHWSSSWRLLRANKFMSKPLRACAAVCYGCNFIHYDVDVSMNFSVSGCLNKEITVNKVSRYLTSLGPAYLFNCISCCLVRWPLKYQQHNSAVLPLPVPR